MREWNEIAGNQSDEDERMKDEKIKEIGERKTKAKEGRENEETNKRGRNRRRK